MVLEEKYPELILPQNVDNNSTLEKLEISYLSRKLLQMGHEKIEGDDKTNKNPITPEKKMSKRRHHLEIRRRGPKSEQGEKYEEEEKYEDQQRPPSA